MYYISIYVFEATRVLLKLRTRFITIHCSKNRCDKKMIYFLYDNLE